MRIELPKVLNNVYGNPLGLKDGEIRDVKVDKKINNLLRCGAVVPVITKRKTIKKNMKITTFMFYNDLIKIKGVGKQNIADIKKHYKTHDELKIALKKNNVSLRNDVVEKLKKFYKVIK